MNKGHLTFQKNTAEQTIRGSKSEFFPIFFTRMLLSRGAYANIRRILSITVTAAREMSPAPQTTAEQTVTKSL